RRQVIDVLYVFAVADGFMPNRRLEKNFPVVYDDDIPFIFNLKRIENEVSFNDLPTTHLIIKASEVIRVSIPPECSDLNGSVFITAGIGDSSLKIFDFDSFFWHPFPNIGIFTSNKSVDVFPGPLKVTFDVKKPRTYPIGKAVMVFKAIPDM